MAANRIGAGLVTVQCEERGDVYRTVLPPEIMVQDDGETIPAKTTVLLGGPGGISPVHCDKVYRPGAYIRVIDSAAFPDLPDTLNGDLRTILTPHDGEFSKLFGGIGPDREEAAHVAAVRCNGIVVLKGATTIIAHPDGRTVINDRPNPNLATAGTGDILAGMISGLAAQSMPAFEASCAAVWMHAEAGEQIGRGLIASDIIDRLPTILTALD